jgi:hypothetical protein
MTVRLIIGGPAAAGRFAGQPEPAADARTGSFWQG